MRTFILATLFLLTTACVDPQSPRVKFIYNGSQTGKVWAIMRTPTASGVQEQMWAYGDSISAIRHAWSGEPVALNADIRIAWFRSQHERGARITAWIDVDGDDVDRCRRPTGSPSDPGPGDRVLPTCTPEPNDPVGITPLPPFEAIIPLLVRDPNG